jgi:hypothetical protein
MKKRATHQVDISDPLFKQVDIRITASAETLVGTSGEVECVKTVEGVNPMIRAEVERALRSWTFKRADVDGNSVAYPAIWNSASDRFRSRIGVSAETRPARMLACRHFLGDGASNPGNAAQRVISPMFD